MYYLCDVKIIISYNTTKQIADMFKRLKRAKALLAKMATGETYPAVFDATNPVGGELAYLSCRGFAFSRSDEVVISDKGIRANQFGLFRFWLYAVPGEESSSTFWGRAIGIILGTLLGNVCGYLVIKTIIK